MGAGHHHLGPLDGTADLHHIHLQVVPLPDDLGRHPLLGGHDGLGGAGAVGDLDMHVAVSRLDAGDKAGQHLMLLGVELLIDHAPLRLADALDDDLLPRLGGDAAEFVHVHVEGQLVAHFRLGLPGPGFLQGQLQGGIGHFLHHGLLDVNAQLLLHGVHVHHHPVGGGGIVLFHGGDEGGPDLFDHIALGDALLLFDQVKCQEEFAVHGRFSL